MKIERKSTQTRWTRHFALLNAFLWSYLIFVLSSNTNMARWQINAKKIRASQNPKFLNVPSSEKKKGDIFQELVS